MQKSNTPKNGTGASLRRRKFLAFAAIGTAAMPCMAVAAVSPKTGRLPPSAIIEPLQLAINEYLDGIAAFNAMAHLCQHAETEAVTAATYGPAMKRLDAWTSPALTRQGATSALRLALREDEEFGDSSPMTISMIKAALGWLEGGAA